MTILVTGATGNIGRRIVDHLIDLGANDIRALTKNPAKAKLPEGVTAVTGYLGDPDSLPAALEGVERMYLAPLPKTLEPTWSFHFGLLVAGWGFFNVVEGLIDHQLLGVHHVRDDLGAPLSWDIGFLVFGVMLIGAGWVLYRRGSRKLAGSAR
jgi:NAD(P)-dependent dehydrogenase (short-subunit alcohol dehydrogenase family)